MPLWLVIHVAFKQEQKRPSESTVMADCLDLNLFYKFWAVQGIVSINGVHIPWIKTVVLSMIYDIYV